MTQSGTAPAGRPAAGASDAGRLRAAARGDVAAFATITESRLPSVFRLASAILGNAGEAAAATEDAFVAAWRELPRLRDPGEFDAWLDRIVVNACRMQIRRDGTMTGFDSEAEARRRAAAIATLLDQDAVLDILDDAFERLDADDRALLALQQVGDRPVSDIALVVHLPTGTVKWRLHEARRSLAGALEQV